MKALEKQAVGPGNVALVDKPLHPMARGDVVLEIVGCGICGTDLHIYDGDFPFVPPVTLGHEYSGTVVEVTDDVDTAWLGARVVCENFYYTCGVCEPCRVGRLNLCLKKLPMGTKLDGGFAAKMVAPARNLHRIPEWLGQHAAALHEPLACVCNSLCDPAVIDARDEVLVIGPGAIGILAAQVARASGGEVLLVGTERDESRLEIARGLGFETALADDTARLDRLGGGLGAHVTVECSGSAPGMRMALERVRRMGRYVQIGHAGKDVTVPMDLISHKELLVRGGQGACPRAWTRALALVDSRRVQLDSLITEVVRLDDWERVFADLRAARGLKYVFDPHLGEDASGIDAQL
jgi:L-iditol 2-dehydrogenase